MKKHAGFTLIEVMITVAIIGILAAVALPAYKDYMTRGKIPDATSTLAVKRTQIEQFFLDNRSYLDAANNPPPACNADTTTSKNFDFSCSAVTATTYTLQAVGKGSMTGFTFEINQSNAKKTSQVPGGWTSNNTCWVVRKSGDCV